MTQGEYTGTKSKSYVAPPGVAEMVNLASVLYRPLLVEGEAGCGKTTLANAVAEELNIALVTVAVKSTSQARDLLYRFDALRRLQDAQDKDNPSAKYIYPYIHLGPLGDVIQSGKRCVMLLDEVDKADIDFPNDLLDVLDRFEFQIPELPIEENELCQKFKGFGREVKPGEHRPIVIITSNREKRLPEAFLRRCLYIRLHFPEDPETLARIVLSNTKLSENELDKSFLRAAVQHFVRIRSRAADINVQKLPSTSELIDWVKILRHKGTSVPEVDRSSAWPPYWRTLFKTYPDLDALEAEAKKPLEG